MNQLNNKADEITIEINAFDTLFFRDGKPFSRGEETWADSIFPPSPSVIYGAIRSGYFGYRIDELRYANDKNTDPTKNLKITGIFLKYRNDDFYYLPLPLDCVSKVDETGKNKNKVYLLLSQSAPDISNYKLKELLLCESQIKSVTDGWMSDSDFERYLQKTENEFVVKRISDDLKKEPKVGIGRTNSTHTATDTMLYRVTMQRPKDFSIVVSFRGLELPEHGMLKVGGEGKGAYYQKLPQKKLKPDIKFDKRFKMVLTTPAIFEQGWLPKWIDQNNEFQGQYQGVILKLVNTVVAKPLYFGGFDLKAHKPKPMRKAVPAGSVYYFEIINGNVQEIVDCFQGKAISDQLANEGFGIVYIGGI